MAQTPDDLLGHLIAMEKRVAALKKIAEMEVVNRKFTLDGRFVGDIGELIAQRYFKIKLHGGQKPYHDAEYKVGNVTRTVQIKARRASDAVDLTKSKKNPPSNAVLVLKFADNWRTWSVVYNGTWPKMHRKKQRFTLANLAELDEKVNEKYRIPRK